MKKTIILSAAGLMALFIAGYVAATGGSFSAATEICDILYNIRDLLHYIVGGIAAVVIVLQGVKWVGSAEDAGARKQAKQGIIHAVIGLIIVMLAVWVTLIIFQAGCGL